MIDRIGNEEALAETKLALAQLIANPDSLWENWLSFDEAVADLERQIQGLEESIRQNLRGE